MNSTIGNIFKYLLYFIFPFIVFYLLNYTISRISEDKLTFQYIYSLEDTIKPSSTYFDFIPNEQNIDTRILNINYTTDEVISILKQYKPEFEVLFQQGDYGNKEFSEMKIHKIDYTKVGREKLVIEYKVDSNDNIALDQSMDKLNFLLQKDINYLILPSIESSIKRINQFRNFLKDKIVLEQKINELKIQNLNFELKTLGIRMEALFNVIKIRNLNVGDVSTLAIDKELEIMLSQINFFETLSTLNDNPLQEEINKLEEKISENRYLTLNKIYLKFAENLFEILNQKEVGLKLVDSKIIQVVDNSRANLFIQILFSLIMTLFFVSIIEFFIKRRNIF